ncbi:hypothetical protein EVAR_63244_1 [Eumeta japonica]|uniref:Uncharacterized protein n=1 Tax=Eumeta variegata TaxID=151549 RepID=A0A4C1Z690_EUMVA|nr:hypothetical protein EVAR_63244_1 [Eumeta japonica]
MRSKLRGETKSSPNLQKSSPIPSLELGTGPGPELKLAPLYDTAANERARTYAVLRPRLGRNRLARSGSYIGGNYRNLQRPRRRGAHFYDPNGTAVAGHGSAGSCGSSAGPVAAPRGRLIFIIDCPDWKLHYERTPKRRCLKSLYGPFVIAPRRPRRRRRRRSELAFIIVAALFLIERDHPIRVQAQKVPPKRGHLEAPTRRAGA